MPHSDVNLDANDDPGKTVAVAAESLYIINLLLLPGLAFIALVILYMKYSEHESNLAKCHLIQTLIASIWAGTLLIIVNILIVLLGGFEFVSTWVVVILYFTIIHASLVVLGTLGLARAMAGKHYHYPVLGQLCPET